MIDFLDALLDLFPLFTALFIAVLGLVAWSLRGRKVAKRPRTIPCGHASCRICGGRKRWYQFWKLVLLLVPSLLLFGCPFEDNTFKRADRTPAGWAVAWNEQGTLTAGLHTKEEVYALFDAAMLRAAEEVERVHGIPRVAVIDRAARVRSVFVLVDHWHFPVVGSADVPGATYATGEIDGGSNIKVAFYSKATASSGSPQSVPATAPAWMVYVGPSTGFYYWGEEQEGNQYPALGYELAHEWGY